MFQGGVELNWLPPTEPNGEVHYVIEYKREDSGNWTSVNTTSDSTHYNLTGLHSGTSYTIRVVAVNSAERASSSTPTSHIKTIGGEENCYWTCQGSVCKEGHSIRECCTNATSDDTVEDVEATVR